MGVTNFYADRSLVPNESWVDWLAGAQRRCILLGQAHGEWIRDYRFKDALRNRLMEGVQVEVFFLDPTSHAADVREREDRQTPGTKERIKGSIKALWEIRKGLNDATTRDRLTVYTYSATPSLGVTWIDDWMLVTHYLAGLNNLTSPALRVEPSTKLRSPYAVYAKNVEQIRDPLYSTKVTDENIGRYIDG
jgi:hypothetical protein